MSTAVGATGNPGMVQTCQNTPGSIAYIGVSFLNQTDKAGLGYAALQNQAGKFVLPTGTTIAAAAAATDKATPPDERISLIFAPGENSYPIINYEYAIVNPKQADPAKAAELKKFLGWALERTAAERANSSGRCTSCRFRHRSSRNEQGTNCQDSISRLWRAMDLRVGDAARAASPATAPANRRAGDSCAS